MLDNKKNVTIDLYLNVDQSLEKIDESKTTIEEIEHRFSRMIHRVFSGPGYYKVVGGNRTINRDKKDIYYRQLLIDLENKIHVRGEWKKSSDDSNISKRLERTLSSAYKELGPVIAEDVFYRAIDAYWYNKYFTLAQSRQS